MSQKIVMYCSTWCPDCHRSKQWFDDHHIPVELIDIATVPGAAATVESLNHGMQSVPTIIFPSGKILVEPSNAELETELIKV